MDAARRATSKWGWAATGEWYVASGVALFAGAVLFVAGGGEHARVLRFVGIDAFSLGGLVVVAVSAARRRVTTACEEAEAWVAALPFRLENAFGAVDGGEVRVEFQNLRAAPAELDVLLGKLAPRLSALGVVNVHAPHGLVVLLVERRSDASPHAAWNDWVTVVNELFTPLHEQWQIARVVVS